MSTRRHLRMIARNNRYAASEIEEILAADRAAKARPLFRASSTPEPEPDEADPDELDPDDDDDFEDDPAPVPAPDDPDEPDPDEADDPPLRPRKSKDRKAVT